VAEEAAVGETCALDAAPLAALGEASALGAASPTPPTGAAVEVLCGGISSVLPALSQASDGKPLAAASASTLRPSVAATDESDSPGATT
jgi:hypothetical protein